LIFLHIFLSFIENKHELLVDCRFLVVYFLKFNQGGGYPVDV